MKTCSKCSVTKDPSNFSPRSSWCKKCKSEHEQTKRINKGMMRRPKPYASATKKECLSCKVIKDHSEFSPSKRGRYGLAAYCKVCLSDMRKSTQERERLSKYQREYRAANREVYLEQHRLRMFRRNTNMKIVSDGSVTPIFLKELYSRSTCYYCSKEIDSKLRTLEHKHPLSKGGLHSIDNIEMACNLCNSSKRDLTEEEFKKTRNEQCCKNNKT